MYSGTTLTKYSGRVMGAHQKIDRVARRHLKLLLKSDDPHFPRIRQILHFEGKNGPDGIKRKSPAKDEPWHYYDPFDDTDTQLLDIIKGHSIALTTELKAQNMERAAFEAAWLAHAIVDGLTPAHHYPYEEKLTELRGGEGLDSRDSIKGKLVIPGETRRDMIRNNWRMWGSKGLMTTHGTFELGVASLLAPLKLSEARPSKADIALLEEVGVIEIFRRTACEIAMLDLYTAYYQKGWTPRLAHQVRTRLGPMIIRTVTMAWYASMQAVSVGNKQS
jgi:hypothetical protein